MIGNQIRAIDHADLRRCPSSGPRSATRNNPRLPRPLPAPTPRLLPRSPPADERCRAPWYNWYNYGANLQKRASGSPMMSRIFNAGLSESSGPRARPAAGGDRPHLAARRPVDPLEGYGRADRLPRYRRGPTPRQTLLPSAAERRFRTLAEVTCRGQVRSIPDLRRGEQP
jgi:hypothetical protein